MSLLRLAQFRLESAGEVDWWFRPPWTHGWFETFSRRTDFNRR